MRPDAQGPGTAAAGPAAAGRETSEAALGLTRGTTPDEALRSRVTADYNRGNDLIAAGQYHGAIAVHSALYALPNLSMTVRFKLCFELAMSQGALDQHETALSFLREAQGLPGVAGDLRASASSAMADIHHRKANARGALTELPAAASVREGMGAAFSAGEAAFHGGQFQAAHDAFMRMYLDQRAVGRFADARASAIMNAGTCKVRLGQAAEGLRLIQDGLAVAGIQSQTRLGGFDLMRAAHLAMSRRTEGSGQAQTRGDSARLFDEAAAAVASGAWARGLDGLMEVYSGPAWARIDGAARGAFVFNIAVCHQRLGHRDEALTWFQNALDRHAFDQRGETAEAIRRLRVEDAGSGRQAAAPVPMQAPVAASTATRDGPAATQDGEPRLSLVPPSFETGGPEAASAAPAVGAARASLALTPDDFVTRNA